MNTRNDILEMGALTVFRLDGTGGARPASLTEGQAPDSGGESTWVHVDFSEPEGIHWLKTGSGVDAATSTAMLEDESRPRALQTDKGILTILRGVNFNRGADFEDMISVRVWVEPGRVITASRRSLKTFNDILHAFSANQGPKTPSGVLLSIIDRIGHYISDVIEQKEEMLEAAETDVHDAGTMVYNSPFSVLRRQTARIRRYMAPQKEALQRISQVTEPVFNEQDSFELREHLNRFTLMLEDLDLVRERALVAQEEFLGVLAHEQNKRMLVLSIVAAVFLPLSFLTGLMGMNVAGLPGTENHWAFAILVLMMLITAGFILLMFKIKNWL